MTEETSKRLSRRDALKLIGAATGAAVLANLPSKWTKPELVNGVLPAHAQTSGFSIIGCLVITALPQCTSPNNLVLSAQVQISPPTPGISMHYRISKSGTPFSPVDPVEGDVLTNNSGIAIVNTPNTGNTNTFPVTTLDFVWSFTGLPGGPTCSHSYMIDNSNCG